MGTAPQIDILTMARTLAPIGKVHGQFDRWFQDSIDCPVRIRTHAIFEGAPLPALSESDGWIITGSPASVNDHDPWLATAKEAIHEAVAAEHAILGVCFGHQLLAVAVGGTVEQNTLGWELGVGVIELTPAGQQSPLFEGMKASFQAYQSHREIVTSLPDSGQALAENGMGLQAFQLGKRAFGLQFHPEFTFDIAQMYVQTRQGTDIPRLKGQLTHPDATRRVLTNFIQHMTP